MPLTRPFKNTVKARAKRDAAFRQAILFEVKAVIQSGDVGTAETLLRDYVHVPQDT